MTPRFSSHVKVLTPIALATALVLIPPAAARGPSAAVLELYDGGKAALSLANATPGASATGCLVLTYRGAEEGPVRLYGMTKGTGFDRYLDLTVSRGRLRKDRVPSCDGFRAEKVVYSGTLRRFPDGPEGAIKETWSPGESHAYRIEITVRHTNAAQGLKTRQTFTWMAPDTGGDTIPAGAARGRGDRLLPTPDVQGFWDFVRRVVRIAGEVAKRTAFPTALILLVILFLAIQDRIDRRDPKLALAPVYPTPDLAFDPPGGARDD